MTERAKLDKAKEGVGKAVDSIGKFALAQSTKLSTQADDVLGAAKEITHEAVEKLVSKRPDTYEEAIVDYNSAFTSMNDNGLVVLRQRERSIDLIELVEHLVNSIANTPKSFETDLESIDVDRMGFLDAEEFARKDLEAARKSAASAGAGFTAGAAVASLAPSATLWVATTFGTASTGTAISTLSGAAASKAALAWIGGGALAAGGGGTAAGSALLALAGPIGWTIAGATLLTSIALLTKKKFDIQGEKQAALSALKQNTAKVRTLDTQILSLLNRTVSLRQLLMSSYRTSVVLFGADFLKLSPDQQTQLASLVNNTKSCAARLSTRVEQSEDDD